MSLFFLFAPHSVSIRPTGDPSGLSSTALTFVQIQVISYTQYMTLRKHKHAQKLYFRDVIST